MTTKPDTYKDTYKLTPQQAVGLYGLPAPGGSIHVDAIESAELTRQMVARW
jgi:hypothetical protein